MVSQWEAEKGAAMTESHWQLQLHTKSSWTAICQKHSKYPLPVDFLYFLLLRLMNQVSVFCLQCGFFVRRREWWAAALHQGRIMGKDKQQQYTDADGFLIQDNVSSSRNRKSPKHWVTSWTETHWDTDGICGNTSWTGPNPTNTFWSGDNRICSVWALVPSLSLGSPRSVGQNTKLRAERWLRCCLFLFAVVRQSHGFYIWLWFL